MGEAFSNERSSSNSCAIVVTYNPDVTGLLKLLGQLNKETDFIVIDNGSKKIEQIADSILVYPRCKYFLRLPANVGLARGLNIGLKWVQEQAYVYAFLFDQDSSLCDLFSPRMIAAYEQAQQLSEKPIAAMGPRLINPQNMRQTKFKLFNRFLWRSDRALANSPSHYLADFLITSGCLLRMQYLDKIGLMKESYFIDNVDLEWCFRASSMGFSLLGTDDAVLYHAIGERSLNPLVKAGLMVQHNPARTYYSSRNRVHLYSLKYSPLGWKLRDIVRFSLKATWLLISSAQRKQYWHHISSGVRDARLLD